jgi:hypothetical protein
MRLKYLPAPYRTTYCLPEDCSTQISSLFSWHLLDWQVNRDLLAYQESRSSLNAGKSGMKGYSYVRWGSLV